MAAMHIVEMVAVRLVNTLIFSLLMSIVCVAQSVRFRPPMDLPIELSGNFMEPRGDHFHSGLDIRTGGREGVPVRAVADGWVSRIKVSPWGYGKALYIDHADGHTSVYAHLQELRGGAAKACLDAQYRKKDFSIDLSLDKGALPIKQGEVIALSGNTGGSAGPHLHFELRRTSDQHALDPEALGIEVPDRVKPEVLGVRLYPLNDSSMVGPYPVKTKGFATEGGDGLYRLKPGVIPTAYGTIGLALHTVDRYDSPAAKCGVRRIQLFVDGIPAFSMLLDEIDFSTTRYCNAHVDYALMKGQRKEYHRCYKQPNNKLRIYGREEAQGRITLAPGEIRNIRFLVTDANGNASELHFQVRGATLAETRSWPPSEPSGSLFRYDTENILSEQGVSLTVPAMVLYDDAYVRYECRPAPPGAVSPLHVLHDPLTPLHSSATLRLDLPEMPEEHLSKALVVRVDASGRASAVGGGRSEGRLTASIRSFGSYTIMLDTVPPVITNVDLKADMKGRSRFTFKVSDNLSSVETWRATMNGEWVLMEYEPKGKALVHTFDDRTNGPGPKSFTLEVTDERGNSTRYEQRFVR